MSDRVILAGVDEVGRGCVAGDVYAAAVILNQPIKGLRDSKKLSVLKRQQLSVLIKEQSTWAIGVATIEEIETLNIFHASLLAMKRAVEQLTIEPRLVLVDGNKAPDWHYNTKTIIGGDDSEDTIAAASIIAKVARDDYMTECSELYPDYGFEKHKGYLTKQHKKAIELLGPCAIHRKGFEPIKSLFTL